MPEPFALYLVVGGGATASARLRVTAAPGIVGRSRSADLVVSDPGVSRQHLRVRLEGGGVQIDAEPGAAPFLYRASPATSQLVARGEHLIIGSTVLAVVADEPGALHSLAETAVDGLDADVRGLTAVAALLDALAAASDAPAVLAIASAWASSTLGTAEVPGLPLSLSASAVDRRLAAVARAVIAASLAAASTRLELDTRAAELRTLAVGSARGFLGSSPAATTVATVIGKLAAADATALLLGESGTGKTFAARLVHEASARAEAPLRVLNCAAIPETLLEAELFGSERGAFSGATGTRIGAFESAGGGTLLLDEIGELSLASQAKLLRALEERRFERLGSNRTLPLRARVLAATNRDLRAMVDAGTFRADLYFRISVVTLTVPPLRDRGDDLQLLAERILADLAPSIARRVTGFTPAAVAALARYGWPGNVRELRNAVEHALVLGESPLIDVGDLPELVRGAAPAIAADDATVVRLPADLRWLEERAIEAALAHTNGNRTKAAALLGINRVTLQKKLAK